ncbi:MAG: hypothetical protein BroJett011_60640 [Chloroflexota bacterium]|nr:MAG: hypothetical protein BroJett011_60640 [Chloroflexota bacterium]
MKSPESLPNTCGLSAGWIIGEKWAREWNAGMTLPQFSVMINYSTLNGGQSFVKVGSSGLKYDSFENYC